jgi:hypothetical protein
MYGNTRWCVTQALKYIHWQHDSERRALAVHEQERVLV